MIKVLNDFFNEKFKSIDKFVDEHQKDIDANAALRERLIARIRMWTTFAALVNSDDVLVGEFFAAAREVGLNGIMELKSKTTGEILDVVSDKADFKETPGKRHLKEGSIVTLMDFAETFDATVVGIK